MEIRKSFDTINNMHIVRNCSSERCKKSLHAHSYKVEIFLEADGLDNGFMVYDFGLMKGTIKEFINCFNNSYTIWSDEPDEFKTLIKSKLKRVIELPVSPSAECFSIVFFKYIDRILQMTDFKNNEFKVKLVKVNVHETKTGFATCDIKTSNLYTFDLFELNASNEIIKSLKDKDFLNKIHNFDNLTKPFINPTVERQV